MSVAPQDDIIGLLESLQGITPLQRRILRERYGSLYTDFSSRSRRYTRIFYTLRVIVTLGSLLVPALLSIQYTSIGDSNKKAAYELTIYWITWILSLAVTGSNGVYTLFKVDKKYYYLVTAFELLKSEAWQYLELTGKYASQPNGPPATHANQYLYFSHALEKHKLKQVEEEYYKLYDHSDQTSSGAQASSHSQGNTGGSSGGGATTTQGANHDTLIPPTPDKSLMEISKSLSPETLKTVSGILNSLGKTAGPETVIGRLHAAVRRASIAATHDEDAAGHGILPMITPPPSL